MSSHTLASSSTSNALSVSELFSVKTWVCVVTGGGTGLGLTTAIALAVNGARVYITGRRAEVLEKAVKTIVEKAGHDNVFAIQGDAATKEGIDGQSEKKPGGLKRRRRCAHGDLPHLYSHGQGDF
jgi:protein-L-isoaspartate O-methyltransferase